MTQLYLAVTILLMVNLALALVRAVRGPAQADRLMVVLLFGTTVVATLALLAAVQRQWALLDVALVLAALAAVISLAFVQLPAGGPFGPGDER